MTSQPSSVESAKQTAMRLLGRRALSCVELTAKLTERGYKVEAVAAATAAMQNYGYLDDATLAANTAAAAHRKGRGPLWIKRTLQRRGVAESLAQRAAVVDAEESVVAARALVVKRFAKVMPLDGRGRERAYRFLCGRGFTASCARTALGAAFEGMD